jgi:hypothetical protein
MLRRGSFDGGKMSIRMLALRDFRLPVFAILFAALGFAWEPNAQTEMYKRVPIGDLLGGSMANGEWVETSGHAWINDEGVFVSIKAPSAVFWIRVDITHVSAEDSGRLKSMCSALNKFSGGCHVTIRGQTAILRNRQGIVATEIRVISRE